MKDRVHPGAGEESARRHDKEWSNHDYQAASAHLTSPATPLTKATVRRIVFSSSVGNALEWFDFLVYGYFATIIAKQFFPTHDEWLSTMLAIGTDRRSLHPSDGRQARAQLLRAAGGNAFGGIARNRRGADAAREPNRLIGETRHLNRARCPKGAVFGPLFLFPIGLI